MSDLTLTGTVDCEATLHPKALEGLELFNHGQYFEAHEALEAAWRDETGPVRNLYRGILQVAVVYLHITRCNYPGAMKVYRRSLRWLNPWPECCRGVSVGLLRQDLEAVIQKVSALGPERLNMFDLSLLKPVSYANA
jgi:hypothetical protein